MKKWIKRIGITLLILLVGFLIGIYFLLKEAFGPKYRTLTIGLGKNRTLIGRETYNADMAAVFYKVDFEMKTKKPTTYKLGTGTFLDKHWDKSIKLYDVAEWVILPVNEGSYSKILFTNIKNNQHIDTVFSPQNLRYDNFWKEMQEDIPSWVYDGSSKLELIIDDKLFISYQYRIGDYEPFKFYNQLIEYRFNTLTGKLETLQVSKRQETKIGN